MATAVFADDFTLYYDAVEGADNNKVEDVANLQKITFDNGNIVITRKDNTTSTLAISKVKRLFFSTEQAVGITDMKAETATPGVIYDLTGRKIDVNLRGNLPKGVYIMDGQKVLIK